VTLEELAQQFIDLYEEAGLDGISDEMTGRQLDASNKFFDVFEACRELVK
jgi:hypothetical protein